MSRLRAAGVALAASVALLGGCGDDDDGDGATTTTTSTTLPTTTSTTEDDATTTTTEPAAPEAGPADAAEAFVASHFPGARVTFGEFRQGDTRSGELDVFRPQEGGGTGNLASTLLLRLDEADEWQVLGAVNPNVTIEQPENLADVPAGPVTVSGVGRGFEATLVVEAAQADGTVVAEAIGMGGAFAEPMPYEVELDLSGVEPGTELVITTAGGTGLENDPGEFAAIRVTVA